MGIDKRSKPLIVTLMKRKLDGGRGCWQAYELGDDADGRWLYTPAGSTYRGSDGTREGRCQVEGGGQPGLDSLALVPGETQHWLASWRVPERSLHVSVEICGWDRRSQDLVSFLDWELDPFRMGSGLVAVEDVDDFVEARDCGLLGQADADDALATAGTIERALRNGTAPFDGRADALLAEAGRRGLPPLTRVPHPFDL